MTSTESRRGVVVGVDGSDEAMAAAEWALEHARTYGLPLHVVTGVDWPVHTPSYALYPVTIPPQAIRDDAQGIVDRVTDRCHATAPDLEVSGEVVQEPPIPALLTASNSHELLVVGCRGLRPVVGALLGSVSTAVVAHAGCPVVVVRSLRQAGPVAPVVAGVDGSDRDEATLGYAFDEAHRRGADLVVVHAWSDVSLVTAMGLSIGEIAPWMELRAQAEALVASELTGWISKYPDVRVRTRVVQDLPVHTLLEVAHTAGLLVVGSHGRGGFLGMLLGSVARRLVQHADCPVLVVRHMTTAAEQEAARVAKETDRAIEEEESCEPAI
jgi:nucleotide-binding universal stress UspA family protein